MSSKLAFGALIFFSLSLPWISWVVPTRRGESNFPGTWGAATSAPFDASLPSTTVSEATEACRYQPLCQVPLWIICLRTLLQSFSLRNAQNVNLKIFKKKYSKIWHAQYFISQQKILLVTSLLKNERVIFVCYMRTLLSFENHHLPGCDGPQLGLSLVLLSQ